MLLLTPEWSSSAARAAAASACEALPHKGFAAAAPVLRAREARRLSKSMLLELCRLWGYRSNVWCVRADPLDFLRSLSAEGADFRGGPTPPRVAKRDVRRKRSRLASVDAAAKKQHTALSNVAASTALARTARPPTLGAIDSASVAALVALQLSPQLERSALALCGPRAREAAARSQFAGFSQCSLRSYAELHAVCDGMAARWTAGQAAQREWHATAVAAAARFVSAAGDGDTDDNDDGGRAAGMSTLAVTPAWHFIPLCAEDAPAEAMLAALRALIGAGMRMLEAERARSREESRAAGGAAISEALAVSQAEYADALGDGAAVAASGVLLLSQLRVAATLDNYAAACELLAVKLTGYARAVAAAMRVRAQWSTELLTSGVAMLPPARVSLLRFFTPVLEKSGVSDTLGPHSVAS